jgi:predicted ATP-grasp superfamily ATP-dependent carboligase
MALDRRPPILLGDARWYGTLAAVRDLGSRGVPVVLASDSALAPAAWSRHCHRSVPSPSLADPNRYVTWLRQFGERSPGHVLYPTSDETAWLLSLHRDSLARHFHLYSPPIETLRRLLDKWQLCQDARAVGLEVPQTWCPADEGELESVGREASFPLFLKPRAQVFSMGAHKGTRVDDISRLVTRWRSVRDAARFHPIAREHLTGVERPLVQAFHSMSDRIYTVDGFVDETGDLYAHKACTKLLQRPVRLGPGILFEDSPTIPAIAEGLRRLCKRVGFFGVFDAEFIEADGRMALIDFNPRFYNHMAFEVDRGLPLSWLVYLAAVKDAAALQSAVAAARAYPDERRAFVHRLPTSLLLGMQAISQAMPAQDRRRWRRWIAEHRASVTDPVRQAGDPMPMLLEVVQEVLSFARHPRSYLRKLAGGS